MHLKPFKSRFFLENKIYIKKSAQFSQDKTDMYFVMESSSESSSICLLNEW